MTIKKLYEWAKEHNVENFELEVELRSCYRLVHENNLYIDTVYEEVTIDTD